MKAILNGKILLENKICDDSILLFDNKIIDIVNKDEFDNFNIVEEIIDANYNFVSPGFIDLHIHGSGGFDTMDANYDSLNNISKSIVKTGVTSFLPTTMTMSKEKTINAFENIKKCLDLNLDGAKIHGVHMEGPFISKKYKGAQNENYILKPDYQFIKPFLDIIKIITFAPEEDVNHIFLNKLKKHKDIRLSMGHTNATFEEAINAIDNGISYVTHTFNAMTGLHHREPGVIGAVFSRDVYCELIADTIHVHKGFFQAFININNPEKVILITDSMRAGCMKCGEYELGGQKVLVDEKSARLEDGTLAGSILKLNKAVKNIKENTTFPLYDIVKMASLNAAKAIGIDHKYGSLKKGKTANIIIFDEDINILKTIINGNILYEAD